MRRDILRDAFRIRFDSLDVGQRTAPRQFPKGFFYFAAQRIEYDEMRCMRPTCHSTFGALLVAPAQGMDVYHLLGALFMKRPSLNSGKDAGWNSY